MSISLFFRRTQTPQVPKTSLFSTDVLSRVEGVNLECCRSVLDGDFSGLDCTFTWRTTPQGHSYWDDRYETESISSKDLQFIQELVRYTENSNNGENTHADW